MNKLEREQKKLEKLKAKKSQHEENIRRAAAIIKAAERSEMKSLKFYVGSAFISALQNSQIDPEYLIKTMQMFGDKRKDYSVLIRSLHNTKASENPEAR